MLEWILRYTVFDWASLLANFAVIVGIFYGSRQISLQKNSTIADLDRRKKQSTIEIYNEFRIKHEMYYYKIKERFDSVPDWKVDMDKIIINDDENIEQVKKELEKDVLNYLSAMEILAAGVSVGIYDIDVLGILCGRAMKERYGKFIFYIESRRKKLGNSNLYIKSKELADTLEITEIGRESRAKLRESI